jgi:hypothetical protein
MPDPYFFKLLWRRGFMKREKASKNIRLFWFKVFYWTLLFAMLLYPSGMDVKALIPGEPRSDKTLNGIESLRTLGQDPFLAEGTQSRRAQPLASLNSDIVAGDSLQNGAGKLYLPLIFKDFNPALYAIVPSVQGLTQSEAEIAIQNAQLMVGEITQGTSPTVPAGRVMSQNPVAGLYVAKGTAVNLVISTGSPTVIVPDLVRHTKAEAQTLIAAAFLTGGTVSFAYHDSIAFDYVISQSPQTGESVAPGSKVDLVVSFGPQGGIPPDPGTVAPPFDPTVATSMSRATEFLYNGPASI